MSENQAKNRLKKRCFNLIGHWLLCHYLFQMIDWRWSVFLNQLDRTHEPCVPTWLLRPYYRTMRLMFHRNSRTPDATKTCLAPHVLFLSPEKRRRLQIARLSFPIDNPLFHRSPRFYSSSVSSSCRRASSNLAFIVGLLWVSFLIVSASALLLASRRLFSLPKRADLIF